MMNNGNISSNYRSLPGSSSSKTVAAILKQVKSKQAAEEVAKMQQQQLQVKSKQISQRAEQSRQSSSKLGQFILGNDKTAGHVNSPISADMPVSCLRGMSLDTQKGCSLSHDLSRSPVTAQLVKSMPKSIFTTAAPNLLRSALQRNSLDSKGMPNSKTEDGLVTEVTFTHGSPPCYNLQSITSPGNYTSSSSNITSDPYLRRHTFKKMLTPITGSACYLDQEDIYQTDSKSSTVENLLASTDGTIQTINVSHIPTFTSDSGSNAAALLQSTAARSYQFNAMEIAQQIQMEASDQMSSAQLAAVRPGMQQQLRSHIQSFPAHHSPPATFPKGQSYRRAPKENATMPDTVKLLLASKLTSAVTKSAASSSVSAHLGKWQQRTKESSVIIPSLSSTVSVASSLSLHVPAKSPSTVTFMTGSPPRYVSMAAPTTEPLMQQQQQLENNLGNQHQNMPASIEDCLEPVVSYDHSEINIQSDEQIWTDFQAAMMNQHEINSGIYKQQTSELSDMERGSAERTVQAEMPLRAENHTNKISNHPHHKHIYHKSNTESSRMSSFQSMMRETDFTDDTTGTAAAWNGGQIFHGVSSSHLSYTSQTDSKNRPGESISYNFETDSKNRPGESLSYNFETDSKNRLGESMSYNFEIDSKNSRGESMSYNFEIDSKNSRGESMSYNFETDTKNGPRESTSYTSQTEKNKLGESVSYNFQTESKNKPQESTSCTLQTDSKNRWEESMSYNFQTKSKNRPGKSKQTAIDLDLDNEQLAFIAKDGACVQTKSPTNSSGMAGKDCSPHSAVNNQSGNTSISAISSRAMKQRTIKSRNSQPFPPKKTTKSSPSINLQSVQAKSSLSQTTKPITHTSSSPLSSSYAASTTLPSTQPPCQPVRSGHQYLLPQHQTFTTSTSQSENYLTENPFTFQTSNVKAYTDLDSSDLTSVAFPYPYNDTSNIQDELHDQPEGALVSLSKYQSGIQTTSNKHGSEQFSHCDMSGVLHEMPDVQDIKDCENPLLELNEEIQKPVVQPFNQRISNLSYFPVMDTTYRAAYRSHVVAVQRAKAGIITDTSRSLDILRQNLQHLINKEIADTIKRYVDKYFQPAMENIKHNNEQFIGEEQINCVCLRILEEALKCQQMSDSDSEKGSESGLKKQAAHKRGRPVFQGDGRVTPVKTFKSGEPVKREGPKWDPVRLKPDTLFVMGARANKALGLGNTRGRLYIRHPDVFKYIGDQEDKLWLCEHSLMPATGGKAYMLLLEDIEDLSRSDEYRDNPGLMMHECVSFTIPEWILVKMKEQMAALRSDCSNRGPSQSQANTSPADDEQMDFVSAADDIDAQTSSTILPFTLIAGFEDGVSRLPSHLGSIEDPQPGQDFFHNHEKCLN